MVSIQRDTDFLYEMGRFRFVERTWRHFFQGELENNAEHTFRVMWIALLLAKCEGREQPEAVLPIALLHDVAESRTGDVNYISRLYTKRLEDEAAQDIFEGMSCAEELMALHKEYHDRESVESKIVKDADNLDVDFEIMEQAALGNVLAETWKEHRREGVRPKLFTESARQLFDEIYTTDPNRWHLTAKNRFTSGDFKPEKQ